ncbi:hypothetical protein [Agarilytica rhodophyticola]|uniref:hypothetical protein n=1 Tax=Agarilytica rhodophyticola TaxID=1737490 RepID=UPI000B34555C|nr:hypothetical protein [Agarilytica rhodophyticola]
MFHFPGVSNSPTTRHTAPEQNSINTNYQTLEAMLEGARAEPPLFDHSNIHSLLEDESFHRQDLPFVPMDADWGIENTNATYRLNSLPGQLHNPNIQQHSVGEQTIPSNFYEPFPAPNQHLNHNNLQINPSLFAAHDPRFSAQQVLHSSLQPEEVPAHIHDMAQHILSSTFKPEDKALFESLFGQKFMPAITNKHIEDNPNDVATAQAKAAHEALFYFDRIGEENREIMKQSMRTLK